MSEYQLKTYKTISMTTKHGKSNKQLKSRLQPKLTEPATKEQQN